MNVGNKHTWQTHEHHMISKPHPHPEQYPCVAQTALEENGRVMYAPLRMLPPSVVYRHRPCAESNGSDHYRFVPDMHPRTSYRQGEYLSQDKKRSEADNAPQMVRQPCHRYHPGFQQDNQQILAATRDLRQEQPTSASSRNDVRHYALWRPEDEERGSGSNHYGFGPSANAHTSNPEREHFHQDRKRLNVHDGVQTLKPQSYPSYPREVSHPSERGFQRDSQHIFRQEKSNSAASRNDVRPLLLGHPEDEERGSGSNHYGSAPPTNPNVPYPESENIREHRKKLKVVDGVQTMIHQPYPSYPPSYPREVSHPSEHGFQRDNQHIFRQEKPNSAASINDVRPRSLWRPEDEERANGSSHYCSGPPTNPKALYPESEYIQQDRKKLKVDDGVQTMIHQPYPSYLSSYPREVSHPSERGFQRDNQHIFRQEQPNSVSSRNDVRPRSLWCPEDEERANASSRHGSGPDTNPKALYPESEYIQQDRKRLKVDDGVQTMVRQPYPSYSPEVSHPSESGFQRDSQAASRKDVRPRSLWCLEEERVGCSNQYGSGPDTNLDASNPVSLSFDQDRKRLEVDDGKRTMVRQPCPSYQPQVAHASEHALAPMAGELRNEKTDSSNGERPHLLWVPEDEQHLTELHCFVRKLCVFIFCATRKDVGSKFNDENDS